jgi:hypothetical protein
MDTAGPIGVTGLWGGGFHVVFPATGATLIGWEMSPFQFEVGMADLAIGVTACISFWRDLSFKAAAVSAASIFLLGDAVGHVKQMLIGGNFAPGNAVLRSTWTSYALCSLLLFGDRLSAHPRCRPRHPGGVEMGEATILRNPRLVP